MNTENIYNSLPYNWITTNLGCLLSELTDYTANGSFASLKENVAYYTDPEYAVLVRTTDLKKKIFKPQRYTDKKGYDFLSKSTLYGGEILMANVGSIGEVYLVPNYEQPMTLAPNMYLIKYKKNELNTMYAFHFMHSNIFLKQLFSKVASTTLKAINKSNFRDIKIPLPPIKEQEKITEILSTVDDKIDAITSQIQKTERLKKGLLKKLLREGMGHIKFKDSEIGKIPELWEVMKLNDISKITMGQSPKSDTYNTDNIGIPLIQGNADCKNRKTIPRNFTTELTKKCFIGDIIMTVRAPVGAISKSLHNACIGRGVCSIKSKEDNEYIYHCLVNYEDSWDKLSQGSTFTAVSGNDIKNLKIALPPIEEQKQIANILSTTDEKSDLLVRKKEKYQTLKKGLLQKLLSGEIRV